VTAWFRRFGRGVVQVAHAVAVLIEALWWALTHRDIKPPKLVIGSAPREHVIERVQVAPFVTVYLCARCGSAAMVMQRHAADPLVVHLERRKRGQA
jgi:hypothetical protein